MESGPPTVFLLPRVLDSPFQLLLQSCPLSPEPFEPLLGTLLGGAPDSLGPSTLLHCQLLSPRSSPPAPTRSPIQAHVLTAHRARLGGSCPSTPISPLPLASRSF